MKRELFLQSPFFLFNRLSLNTKAIIPALLWFIVTTILLCIPGKKLPSISWFHIYQIDKLVHISIFLVLSFLFCRAISNKKWFFLVALFCSFYGMIMEFVQENYIPNRSFDFWDIVADTIGSFGVFILLNLKKK